MALTVTKLFGPSGAGGRWEACYAVSAAAADTYPTGGWTLNKNTLGASANDPTAVVQVENHARGYELVYDNANQKLQAYRQTAATGALAEVPNGTDLTAVLTSTNPAVVTVNYALGI